MAKLTRRSYSFTSVPNALLRDETISLKAKGLYCLMFSKPENWEFYEKSLVKESKDGRDAVRAGLKELIDAGWLIRSGGRDDGMFDAYDYEIVEDKGCRKIQQGVVGKSVSENPTTIKTEQVKTENNNLPLTPSTEPKAKKHDNRGSRLEAYLGHTDRNTCPTEWEEWSIHEYGWGMFQCLEVFNTFRDYWRAQPGNKGVKADWPATWRNWCRRQNERQQRNGSHFAHGGSKQAAVASAVLVERMGAQGVASGRSEYEPAGSPGGADGDGGDLPLMASMHASR